MQLGRQPVTRCFGKTSCRSLRSASALRAVGPRSSLPRPADVPLLRHYSVAATQQHALQHISQPCNIDVASAPPLRSDCQSVGDVASPSQLASHQQESLHFRSSCLEPAAVDCEASTSGSFSTVSQSGSMARRSTLAGSDSLSATPLWKRAAAALDGLQARSNQLVLASVLSGARDGVPGPLRACIRAQAMLGTERA